MISGWYSEAKVTIRCAIGVTGNRSTQQVTGKLNMEKGENDRRSDQQTGST